MENITIENLYDLKETIAADLFTEAEYPWEVLPRIHDFILELGKRLPEEIYEKRGEDIWVAKNVCASFTPPRTSNVKIEPPPFGKYFP